MAFRSSSLRTIAAFKWLFVEDTIGQVVWSSTPSVVTYGWYRFVTGSKRMILRRDRGGDAVTHAFADLVAYRLKRQLAHVHARRELNLSAAMYCCRIFTTSGKI